MQFCLLSLKKHPTKINFDVKLLLHVFQQHLELTSLPTVAVKPFLLSNPQDGH